LNILEERLDILKLLLLLYASTDEYTELPL